MGLDEGLERLNALSATQTAGELLKCCGSMNWAREMAARRPFADVASLMEAAERIWRGLGEQDWLEAFSAHPKIGGRRAQKPQDAQAQVWSNDEQAGARGMDDATQDELAAANSAYEAKFGYIFIVCATGKTAAEMLALLRARLPNEPDVELHNAADEQSKITRLRLEKLLTQ
ncbi:MAG: 2-oxo-4-hydroxy-4-carboxy-5-ureidoimidazoline decarboxylase [Pyrinomonadaceae bacterium]